MLATLAAFPAAFSFAQAVPAPDVVAVPYGDFVSTILDYVTPILLGVSMWAFRFVPGRIRAILMTMQVEQLLTRAISFGINSVREATKDKTLTIDVSNAVLREALGYALLHGGPIIKKFMGKPEDIAEKLWARLPVEAEVAKPNFGALAVETVVAIETRQPERAEKASVTVD